MLGSIVNKRKAIEEDIKTETDNSEDETKSSSKICRLGKCEVCAQNEAKYTCPRCEVKTCCLNCVNVHKKELECNGIRDRTKYIPLRKMTDMDFMSDYYFLEECARFTRNRQHDPIKRITRYNKSLPVHLFRLRNAANERKTKLRFLLQNFTRHKQNTTYFDWKLHRIFWRVEWIFVQANNTKYVDERCDEDSTLQQLLDKHLDAKSSEKKELLQKYQTTDSLQILLKAECVKRSGTRFYALDSSKTLRENLTNKTLVEHPIIYVICDQHLKFEIIDNEEKVQIETKSYEAVLEQIQANQRKAAWQAKKSANKHESDEDAEDCKPVECKEKVGKLLNSDEVINQTNNFLFSDERLLAALSSDDEDGAETEEEK